MADPSGSLIDLKAIGEPVSKLIDAVRAGTGVMYEPTRIRRRAKAEADARIILAKADIQISEIAQRAAQRLSYREVRRQENIEAVVDSAMKQLPDCVAKEPVDDDWLVGFFDYCQDISGEQLQQLWGKLLAGEVSRPGTFSLRTLNMVKVLRATDATIFTELCRFVWRTSNLSVIPLTEDARNFIKTAGLPPIVMAHLTSLGLIQAGMGMHIPIHAGEGTSFDYHGQEHVLSLHDESGSRNLHVDILSDIGNELARVVSVEHDEAYRSIIIAEWRKMSIDVKELPRKEAGCEDANGEESASDQSPEFSSPEPVTVN